MSAEVTNAVPIMAGVAVNSSSCGSSSRNNGFGEIIKCVRHSVSSCEVHQVTAF